MTKSKNNRIPPMSVRFTPEEYALVEQAAASAGVAKSTFVKKATLNHKLVRRRKPVHVVIKDKEALLRVYHELRKSGFIRTFNAVANTLAKGEASINLVEKATLLNASADIKTVRQLLEKALGFSS